MFLSCGVFMLFIFMKFLTRMSWSTGVVAVRILNILGGIWRGGVWRGVLGRLELGFL